MLEKLFLGSVDISSQPNESRNEADKAHVISSELFESRKHPSVVFDFLAFSLKMPKILGLHC
jgi:hypothetical protein